VDEGSFTNEGTDNFAFGDDLQFETPCGGDEGAFQRLNEAFTRLDSESRPTFDVQLIRQFTLVFKISTFRMGVMLSPECRVDLTLADLVYQKMNRMWLTEAQQICATRIGGRFADAVARPLQERGALSVDSTVLADNQLCIRRCSLGCVEEGASLKAVGPVQPHSPRQSPEESPTNGVGKTGSTTWLLESLDVKEDNLSVKWQGACGEPHRVGSGLGDYLFI